MYHATALGLVPKARTYVLSSAPLAAEHEGVSHARHCVFEKTSARFYMPAVQNHSLSLLSLVGSNGKFLPMSLTHVSRELGDQVGKEHPKPSAPTSLARSLSTV